MDNKTLKKTCDIIIIVNFFLSQKLETNHLCKKKKFQLPPPPLCGTQFISLYVI